MGAMNYLRKSTPCVAAPILDGMRLLRSHEVKALLGYTDTGSFWAAVRAAGVPFIRMNARRIYFEEAALKAWLESKTVGRRHRF